MSAIVDTIHKHLFPVILVGLVVIIGGISYIVKKRMDATPLKPSVGPVKRRKVHTVAGPVAPPPASAEGFQTIPLQQVIQTGGQVIAQVEQAIQPIADVVNTVIETGNYMFNGGYSCSKDVIPSAEYIIGPCRDPNGTGGVGSCFNNSNTSDATLKTTANTSGTNFDDVTAKQTEGRTFEETPLDTSYDEYELNELNAQVGEVDRLNENIVLTEGEITETGGVFSPTDTDITNIPWDSENRDNLPSDVLWGFVSQEASKGLFLKVYQQQALSLESAVVEMRPGDDSSPPAFQVPDLPPVNPALDPVEQAKFDVLVAIVSAVGQPFNPLDRDNVKNGLESLINYQESLKSTNSTLFDGKENLNRTLRGNNDKIKQIGKKLKAINKTNLKGAGPILRLKTLFQKIQGKIQRKMLIALQRFITKKTIKTIIIQVTTKAAVVAATAASFFSGGVGAPLLAAAIAFMTLMDTIIFVIDMISLSMSLLLPPILEKFLDGEGICPPGSKVIQQIIPNFHAYLFFTSFVPLGDLFDLFGPYVCWDGIDAKIKQRLYEPTYLEDSTLSLMYHTFPDSMTTRGRIEGYGQDVRCADSGFQLGNDGVCRRPCDPGTYTTTTDDPLCHQIIKPALKTTPTMQSCAQMKALDPNFRDSAIFWEEQAGSDICFEPFNQGGSTRTIVPTTEYNNETGGFYRIEYSSAPTGCGCQRKTKLERTRGQCPTGYSLDEEDLRCYSCPSGYERRGLNCFSPRASYFREAKRIERNEYVVLDEGYQLPTTLQGLSPVNAQGAPDRSTGVYTDFCNFASPVMLDRMAQFYYDQSYANPEILEVNFVSAAEAVGQANVIVDTPENRKKVDLSGGPVLIKWDYITRFFGVVASSELSCDVACEIRTITLNPITGAFFQEEIGCNNVPDGMDCNGIDPSTNMKPFQCSNPMCYRRFYFTKLATDQQGLFTVTGCTNSDGTAHDAAVTSWDEGVEYVPSLPKVFRQRVCENPITWSLDDLKAIGFSVGTGLAGMAAGAAIGLGKGVFGRFAAAGSAIGGAVGETYASAGMQKLQEKYTKDSEEKRITKVLEAYNENGTTKYTVVKSAEVVMNNRAATALISFGPVVEDSVGIVPIVRRCANAALTQDFCSHKYVLRDTIRKYEELNPTKHVKQVDLIEPRGGKDWQGTVIPSHGCYYRWKEVNYDPATNREETNFVDNELIYKYTIDNNKTCAFKPVELINEFNQPRGTLTAYGPNDYPIRTVNMKGSIAYPTRIRFTKPVRFIRIERALPATADSYLQLSQIVVLNTDFQNVAKGRMPTATAGMGGESALPNIATDGILVAREYPNIYHSNTTNGVFEIDLGKEHFIQAITCYNRASLTTRWNGYVLRCLDVARAEVFRFSLQGEETVNGVTRPRLEQTFSDFPTIDLRRRRPFESFVVPRALPPQVKLGTAYADKACTTTCSSSRSQVQKLMDEFNSANPSTKILKVLKAWTSKPNRCDFEVEMMRVQADGKKTISRETTFINVTRDPPPPLPFIITTSQGWIIKTEFMNPYTGEVKQTYFQLRSYLLTKTNVYLNLQTGDLQLTTAANLNTVLVQLVEVNTVDKANELLLQNATSCSFKRVSDGAATINSGTFIQENTPPLVFNDTQVQTTGVSSYEGPVGQAKNFFTGLIETLKTTKPLDTLKEKASKADTESAALASYLAVNTPLQGCSTKCRDTTILSAIATGFSKQFEKNIESYGGERRRMKKILRAAAGSGNECDILYEESVEYFEDHMSPPTETESRIAAARVKLGNRGNCTWVVPDTPTAFTELTTSSPGLKDSASILSSGEYSPQVCPPVDCRNQTLLNDLQIHLNGLIKSRTSATNDITTYKQVIQSFANGSSQCQYKILKDITIIDPYTKKTNTASDMETYITVDYTPIIPDLKQPTAQTICTDYTYKLSDDIQEVFAVNPAGGVARANAAKTCGDVGAVQATYAQLLQAQRNGAHWCTHGWVSDSNRANAYAPLQNTSTTCKIQPINNVHAGIFETPATTLLKLPNTQTPGAAAICYGKKPIKGKYKDILDFYPEQYSLRSPNPIVEFSPDELEVELNEETGEEEYYFGKQLINPPALFQYDPVETTNARVCTTVQNMSGTTPNLPNPVCPAIV